MAESTNSLRHSLMIRTAGAMTLIGLVVLAGMGGALLIAETTRGNAVALNIAGSLRMQSYRISNLAQSLHVPGAAVEEGRKNLEQALSSFEQTLLRRELNYTYLTDTDHQSAALHQGIVRHWREHMKPLLMRLQSEKSSHASQDLRALLPQTQLFVQDIDNLVSQIERETEARIAFLRFTIGATLGISLLVMLLTMYLLHRTLLRPLHELVGFTARIRHGDLAARTTRVGLDELGRLGHAFNLMAQDLQVLYGELEARVAEKTQDLERSNRCLELMYHSIARLYGGAVDADAFTLMLREIEEVLQLGPGSVCLVGPEMGANVSVLSSTLRPEHGEIAFCSLSSCAECLAGDGLHVRDLAGHHVLAIGLRDGEKTHGVLQLMAAQGHAVEPWKLRLLEALALHIGTAIGIVRRVEHQRLLSLMEERSVIARELHDSLAQSLSYMKIQVSRLSGVLERQGNPQQAQAVLDELREGLHSAYRQLRELLTTFRLRIEDENLAALLEKTAQEFTQRGALEVRLDAQLTNCNLTANDEIHVLQIVREALSNVVHHAQAQHAYVSINREGDGKITLRVADDGMGIGHKSAAKHHYGMAIMEERARSLGGVLTVADRPQGGVMVEVRFDPAQRQMRQTGT